MSTMHSCNHSANTYTTGGIDGPLRAQWATSDRCTLLTIRVRIGVCGVGNVLNGISSAGELEVPLRDRESWKITTARHIQSGCWNR